jgi:hypothetical protein
MIDPHSCPSEESLVTALYGETTPEQQGVIEAHLAACATCREQLEALGALRLSLQQWHAPALPANFRLVAEPAAEAMPSAVVSGPARWSSRAVATAALAAAAMLVVGVAASLANLGVTVGAGGVTFRTGWGRAPEAAQQAPGTPSIVSSMPAVESAAAATPAAAPVGADVDDLAWRREVAAAEQRLMAALEHRLARTASASPVVAQGLLADEVFMQRVQELLDASETRQQRNLALRITELARDFDLQRKSDLVTIQQGLGQLEGRTQAEAARTRELVNYIVRVSGANPQR